MCGDAARGVASPRGDGAVYARTTTIQGRPQTVGDAVAYIRDEAMPTVRQMPGNVGLSMLTDRETGRCIIATAWADEEALRASAEPAQPLRDRLTGILGGQPEVREWEIAVVDREHPVGDGAAARLTWVHSEPGQADRVADGYRNTLMPRITQLPGFRSLSFLVDRRDGLAVGAVGFDNRAAVAGSREHAAALRELAVQALGVQILDVAEMDLALAHLRVPETV